MPNRNNVSRCLFLLILFMFLLALTPLADLEGIAAHSTRVVSKPEKRGIFLAGTPHGPIAIDGDADFSTIALLEGWPGDGSPENPYIIDGLDIDLVGGVGNCISISSTRVSFTISNCNLTGAIGQMTRVSGVGIYLENVKNGELVNNTCSNNTEYGIFLSDSDSNTVSNNIYINNRIGIYLTRSHQNYVANNMCKNNSYGISLSDSTYNTVTDNTCTGNVIGIYLWETDFNFVNINTCSNNTEYGILLRNSESNTVIDNTCFSNGESGIYLEHSNNIAVAGNMCTSNGDDGISVWYSNSNIIVNNNCTNNEVGIGLVGAIDNVVFGNTCTSNDIGIFIEESHRNTVSNNIYINNRIGIYLYLSSNNLVTYNTCLRNTEHDIYFDESDSNIVEFNITTGFYSRLLLFGGVFSMLLVGIVVLGPRWHIASAIIQRTKLRLVFWFRKGQGGPDDIIVPIRYRLVSWFRRRRPLKHIDVDEPLEPDSSDQ